MTIPTNTCRTIIKQTTGLRAGQNTSRELSQQLTETGILIAETAGKIAKHNGRKTVSCDDIRLAVEILQEE